MTAQRPMFFIFLDSAYLQISLKTELPQQLLTLNFLCNHSKHWMCDESSITQHKIDLHCLHLWEYTAGSDYMMSVHSYYLLKISFVKI